MEVQVTENILGQNSSTFLRASCNAIQFLLDENFHNEVPMIQIQHQNIPPDPQISLPLWDCSHQHQVLNAFLPRALPTGTQIACSCYFYRGELNQLESNFFSLPRYLSGLFPSSTTGQSEKDPRNAKSSWWSLAHGSVCGAPLELH